MVFPTLNLEISLAACRVNANLTQQEVAEKLRVSKTTVNNWENGKGEPSLAQLKEISEWSKIPIQFITMPKKS